MKNLYLILFLLVLSLTLGAQTTPVQLGDLNPGAENSSPTRFFEFNDRLLFRADAGDIGVELFVTDGTPEGTMLVRDINTDPDLSTGNSQADHFTLYDGRVFFKARAAGLGDELWVTDGTTEGTMLFRDIQPGEGNANPFDFIVYDSLLYFTANDGEVSSELWRTDGTPEGTERVVDIRPGDAPGNPNFKTVFDGKLFFTANDGVNGNELWMSDGTAAGTSLVKDIRTGPASASPSQYFEYQGFLYFRARNDENGTELWRTDGTEDGTILVSDIRADGNSNPSDFFVYQDRLFFVANDGEGNALWETDATTLGVRKIIVDGLPLRNPDNITVLLPNQTVFLTVQGEAGREAIFADSSSPFGDFSNLGSLAAAFGGEEIDDVVYTGSNLYFATQSQTFGLEIGRFPLVGFNIGDDFVIEIVEGPEGSSIDEITLLGDQLVFEADDTLTGREPWALEVLTSRISLADDAEGILTSGDTLDLGTVSTGFTISRDLVFRNDGNSSSILFEPQLDSVFAPFATQLLLRDENGIGILPPGAESNRLTVSFTPTETGTFTDSITLVFPTVGATENVTIYLTGATATPVLGVSEDVELVADDSTLDFNDVPERTDSVRTLTLTNVGDGQLIIDSVALLFDTVFSATVVADTLEANETTEVAVTFTATMIGDYTDVLTVFSSDAALGEEFTVNLNGSVILNSLTDRGLPARAVYPNPVDDQLTVELVDALREGVWTVYDTNGRLLLRGAWPAGQRSAVVPTAELAPGLYHVEIAAGERRLIARVVKR